MGHDAAFAGDAEALGRAMAASAIRLIYGGGNIGLMGTLARSVLSHGGEVTGIIPEFLKARELMLKSAQETLVVADMHMRKRLMFERADAFVALAGGIGTLEELVEQLTWAQLGQHGKPILLLDTRGFWQPLLGLIAHMRERGFIAPSFELRYLVTDRVENVLAMLRDAAASAPDAATEARLDALVSRRF